VNKTAASATQFAKCILLHASVRTTVASSCARTNKIAYFLSWYYTIFGYKLTIKAENSKKFKNSKL